MPIMSAWRIFILRACIACAVFFFLNVICIALLHSPFIIRKHQIHCENLLLWLYVSFLCCARIEGSNIFTMNYSSPFRFTAKHRIFLLCVYNTFKSIVHMLDGKRLFAEKMYSSHF